jgi:D-glycero-D-manno-heptose 1,7-bisphosphate phosphatase
MVVGISAVFIDRDGTLNDDVGYLSKPGDVAIIPGSAEALARLNAEKIPVVVVINQSGIGRGRYQWSDFRAVMYRIADILVGYGAHIDAVYAAPHHSEGLGIYSHPDHPDRKPNPGMLLRAAEEHGIDLCQSWMIGDKR